MHECRRCSLLTQIAPLALVMLVWTGNAPASDWNVSIAASSNYLVRGLTRSRNEPVLQAHVGWAGDQRWSMGAWASTIEMPLDSGPRQEFDFYVARSWPLGRDWRVAGQLTRYEFRGGPAYFSYDYTELAASISLRDALFLSVAVSPDYSDYSSRGIAYDRAALSYELSGRLPVNRFLQLTSGVGRMDLDDLFGASYWYWSGGAELAIRRVTVGVSYVGADGAAEQLFGGARMANTWITTVAIRLY